MDIIFTLGFRRLGCVGVVENSLFVSLSFHFSSFGLDWVKKKGGGGGGKNFYDIFVASIFPTFLSCLSRLPFFFSFFFFFFKVLKVIFIPSLLFFSSFFFLFSAMTFCFFALFTCFHFAFLLGLDLFPIFLYLNRRYFSQLCLLVGACKLFFPTEAPPVPSVPCRLPELFVFRPVGPVLWCFRCFL